MDATEAATEFAVLFPRVYRRFCRRTTPHDYRPTPETLGALLHLAQSGPVTVTEAARHLRRSQAAMSELLARLVARGLLTRVRDQRDRRRTLVWLTPAAERMLDQARQVLSPATLARALQRLSPAQRRQLVRSTRLLLQAGSELPGSRK